MGLSRSEWLDAAERGAAVEWGREHKGWFVAKHSAPFIGVAVLLAGAGLGMWWLYEKASAAIGSLHAPDPNAVGIPTWAWVLVALAAIGTPFVFRSRYGYTPTSTKALKVVAVSIVWLGIIAFLVSAS